MKPIEDRARLYALLNGDGCNGECEKCTKCHEYRIYTDIATEQKVIDDDHLREVKKMVVDKACEWIGNVSWIDDFRKAIEE